MKNSADLGGCYSPRPSVSVDNTLLDLQNSSYPTQPHSIIANYYMEESVLLGTKPLVDSIRHSIRDPSGVFSVLHLCECRIVQWRHDSRLLLLLNWYNKSTLHVGSKIWILCSRGKNNISLRSLVRYCSCHSNVKFISSRHRVISSIYFSRNTVIALCHAPP